MEGLSKCERKFFLLQTCTNSAKDPRFLKMEIGLSVLTGNSAGGEARRVKITASCRGKHLSRIYFRVFFSPVVTFRVRPYIRRRRKRPKYIIRVSISLTSINKIYSHDRAKNYVLSRKIRRKYVRNGNRVVTIQTNNKNRCT